MNREEFEQHIKDLAHKATFEEVQAYYDQKVKSEEDHWGKDYIYAEWARENRERRLQEFAEGKPVIFYEESDYFFHYDSGCCGYGGGSWGEDVVAHLYSDGTYKMSSYSAD